MASELCFLPMTPSKLKMLNSGLWKPTFWFIYLRTDLNYLNPYVKVSHHSFTLKSQSSFILLIFIHSIFLGDAVWSPRGDEVSVALGGTPLRPAAPELKDNTRPCCPGAASLRIRGRLLSTVVEV